MNSRRFPSDLPFTIADFTTKLQELTVHPEEDDQGWQGPSFVLGRTLAEWLASPALNNNPATRAAWLLDRCFTDQEHVLPISDDDILHTDKSCPLMFSMLLEMGCGELVADLHRIGLHDACLPMTPNELSRHVKHAFPRWHSKDIKPLAETIAKEQWKYFPLDFSYNMRPLPLDRQKRLPICERVKVGKGGTAEVYKIIVPEEFVDTELRNAVPCSVVQHTQYGLCYQFALKNFLDRGQEMCDNEISAYRRLQDQEHVIKCLGGFSHFDRQDVTMTHSILLEYGICDLAEYFKHVGPPDLAEDVESFWSALFNIVKAVRDIHDYRAPRGGREENYDGWHGDIKPDNILMTERLAPDSNALPRRELKLADPGFVNFVRSSKTQSAHGPLRKLHGFTSTYGPPEVNARRTSVEEPWAVDIWSLGCVLSEAATWIVFPYGGRAAYSALRRDATKKLMSKPQFLSPDNIQLGVGNFFHDGHKVLPTVSYWHNLLRSKIRRDDVITEQVLDLVDTQLLVDQPSQRMRAEVLCSRLDAILELASQRRMHDRTPRHFHQYIKDAKKKALEACDNPSQMLDDLTLDDFRASRSAMSAILTFMDSSAAPPRSHINPIESRRSHGSLGAVPEMSIPLEQYHEPMPPPPEVRLDRTPTLPPAGTLAPEQSDKTVFDVHYERRDMEKKIVDKMFKASRKFQDPFLAHFYMERDIVFLVDNAGSMLRHWSEVMFVLTELAGKARNQDTDGMDLMFTQGNKEVKNAKKNVLELFAEAISSPEVRPRSAVPSNLGERLNDLLTEWRDRFRRNPKTKRMTVIVLTDGQWYTSTGSDEEFDLDRKIVSFGVEAKKLSGFETKKRPVSIQFVSFGQDPSALARLQRLDDTLHHYGVEDIVDTEPSTGNVYKMLLGSFIKLFDDLNTTQAPPSNESLLSPQTSNYSFAPSPNGSYSSSSQSPYSTPRTTMSSLQASSPSPHSLPHTPSRNPRSSGKVRSERMSLLGNDTPGAYTSSHKR